MSVENLLMYVNLGISSFDYCILSIRRSLVFLI